MIWKRYQNEMFIVISLLLMGMALLYKNSIADRLDIVNNEVEASIAQIGEIAALKKQWNNKNVGKKIESIKRGIAADKVKSFEIKNRKLLASFRNLSATEMNNIILRLENIAVQISTLNTIRKSENSYNMEIVCKW